MNCRSVTRCITVFLALLMAAGLFGAGNVFAHTTPTGSTATGIAISLTVFLADGTSPAVSAQPLAECETIYVQSTLSVGSGGMPPLKGAHGQ